MPFIKKYSYCGETERIRIPKIYLGHIENILKRYDEICGTKGEDYVFRLQQKIEDGLDNI